MVFMDIMIAVNTLLTLCIAWAAREFWIAHKAQHARTDALLEKFSELYARKNAVERSHQRIDHLEERVAEHDQRLVHLETRVGEEHAPGGRR